MFAKLFRLVLDHPSESLAILVGLIILASLFLYPAWWGERSQGALIGTACSIAVVLLFAYLQDEFNWDAEWAIPWLLVVVPTGTALVLRKLQGVAGIRFEVVRFNIPIPANASPQVLMLLLDALILLIFVAALIRSLSRGESVSIESHWGGLGGGIAGWRFSAPLIYLLGIAFLVAITSAVAWRIFPPPVTASQQAQQQQQQQVQVHPPGSSSTSPAATGAQTH